MGESEQVNSHFDVKTLMRSLDYEMDFIKSILEAAHESLDEFVAKSAPLVSDMNKPELKKIAHKLKGTSLSLRFNKLAELAKSMETIDKLSDDIVKIKHQAMLNEIKAVKELIDQEIEQI